MKQASFLPTLALCAFALSVAPDGAEARPATVDRSETETKNIGGSTWWPIGPAPIQDGQAWPSNTARIMVSGRVNAVAVNPDDPDDIWIGTATGGVWRRVLDAEGRNDWQPMSDDVEHLAVGAVELDDCDGTHCNTIWVGTGENSIRRDTYYGGGVLRGTEVPPIEIVDRTTKIHETQAIVWELLGEEVFTYGSVTGLAIDRSTPPDDRTLYVALSSGVTANATHSTVTAPKPAQGYGIFRSTDHGESWERLSLPGTSDDDRATDLEMDPQDPDTLYAGIQNHGIFRSTNGGDDWEAINDGLEAVVPTGDFPEIAVYRPSVAEPAWLYAVIDECPSPHTTSLFDADCDPGVYRSTDGGDSWEERKAPGGGVFRSYTMYTHALTIDPEDPETVWYGGVLLYRSQNGGQDWSQVGTNILHPDHHALSFAPSDPDVVYNANDGGVWISENGGDDWEVLNRGLQITQVQSVSISPQSEAVIVGTQDNGTNMFVGSRVWTHIDDGDSASTVMDADTAAKVYDVYARLFDSPRRCTQWGPDKDAFEICGRDWPTIDTGITDGDDEVAWYPPIEEDPNASETFLGQPQHPLYHGTVRLYRSTDDGGTWEDVSEDRSSMSFNPEINAMDAITAIAVAPSDSDRIYIGYYDGGIWRTDDAGTAPGDWQQVGGPLGDRVITSLAVAPDDRDTVYVTYSEWGIAHVYRSTTGGDSWSAIDDGLPDLPANVLAIEEGPPQRLWLGTDRGIYVRPGDLSEPWEKSGQFPEAELAFPNVAVYDLAVDEERGRIYAGTHGRGVWVLTEPFVDNFEGWVDGSIWDIPVFGNGFLPADTCTVSVILESGATCWEGSVDVEGGEAFVDGMGRLVTSNDTPAGMWNGKQVFWACRSGSCIGGLDIETCQDAADDPTVDLPSSVRVDCNGQEAFHRLRGCPALENPPASPLRIDLDDAGDRAAAPARTLEVFPTVQVGIPTPALGGTRPLCSVVITISEGDDEAELAQRVAQAVNARESCATAGIEAFTPATGEPPELTAEDPASEELGVFLNAPGVTGSYLFPSVRVGPANLEGSCVSVGSLGVPILGQLGIVSMRFETAPGGAAGGELTIMESSPLGLCEITVDTLAGQDGEEIAEAFEERFRAPGIPGPNPRCKVAENPLDVSREGRSLIFVLAQDLVLCFDDPGVGVFIAPEELPGVPPIADAGEDRDVEATMAGPVNLLLDGSGSSDADSTPGTNDDVTDFRWYRELPDLSRVLIGQGETIIGSFAPGAHRVILEVEDSTGLRDEDFVQLTVRPPDCNDNGIDDATDIGNGTSQDINTNGIPDECEVRELLWLFSGTAQGGQVSVTLQGFTASCTVAIMTNPGESAATVTANLAAAINADACMTGQGITASASGNSIRIEGFLLEHVDTTVTDPGIGHEIPVLTIPGLGPWGLAVLVLLLGLAGVWALLRQGA